MSDQSQPASPEIKINTALAQRIQAELGQNVYLCYQCVKCTSGCPVGEYFDWQPNQVMRALQLGQEDIALHSQTPWLCTCCQTCTTRCPQGLDIAGIMEYLTREALARGIKPSVPEVAAFNKAFMREVKLWGRSYELGLMAEMKLRNLRTHKISEDLDLGIKVIQKNKLPFLPSPARRPRQTRPIPGAAKAIAYYPGCSLHSTAKEYNHSTKAVCQALDLKLVEPKGWVCCGSSAAHRSDHQAALRLPIENLALIEQSGFDEVVMPCAACFSRHKTAQFEIRNDEGSKAEVDAAIGYGYQDSVRVSSLGEAILRRVGPEQISSRVKRPLSGLRVVCYYGCLLTRPPQVTEADHPENPMELDRLVSALGAQVVDWSYKTSCCGAAHSLTRPDIVLKLSSRLIEHAREAGADVIAVACPLCHTNMDARQFQMKLAEPMPVLYFTQLMALALGLPPEAAALNKNLVDPRPLLKEKGYLND
ncbi:MAG TPA: heterodisulfide reductase-related iron-sulfur binding cluster [Anaerolineales bacterium]|nr:heterodisulfide reductase-related iron-sulfur binding cluster [Anaerolineales bacterium]